MQIRPNPQQITVTMKNNTLPVIATAACQNIARAWCCVKWDGVV